MKKRCLICGKEFETIKGGTARKYCFECSPTYKHGNNIERGSSITAIRHAIKRQLVKYKGDKCIKCGYNKCIGALQFHHKDRNIKDFDLASQYNGGHLDMEVLYKEVDKCDLLCANCHAEEHFYN